MSTVEARKGQGLDFLLLFLYAPSPGIASCVGTAERYMTPTLDAALLYSSRAGSDLGCESELVKQFNQAAKF